MTVNSQPKKVERSGHFVFKYFLDFISYHVIHLPSFNVRVMGPPYSSQGQTRLGHLAAAASLASIRHTARTPVGLRSYSGCCVNGFSFSELHPVKGSRVAFDWKQNKGKAEFCWTKSTRNNPYPKVFMVGNTAYL